jgi:peptidoglycan/LPS O-acetylase OafA/YrhL
MSIETATEIPASAPILVAPDIAKSPKLERIAALDFTRGALVLIMVFYHWVNYFVGSEWKYYDYLRFLTPSFIFIAGFMISNIYLSRFKAADPRLSKRLFTRGLKILAIFVVLNVARTFLVPALGTGVLAHGPLDRASLFVVFVSGNLPVTGPKLASFSILVPISYLLIISGVLMLPYRRYRNTFHVVVLFLLLSILALGLTGQRSYNLEFVTIGMLGVLSGFTSIAVIDDLLCNPYRVGLAYLFYLIAITIWSVPFVLVVVAVFLNLAVLYRVGAAGEPDAIRSEIILLGKYSLFGYISQIAILQILSAAFHRANFGFAVLATSFALAFVLTIASVEIVDRARSKSAGVDKLYKTVFA